MKRLFVIGTVVVIAGVTGCRSRDAELVRDFALAVNLDDGTNASANVSLGDLDRDGDLDMVLARGRHWGDTDLVLLNDGAGKFTSKELGPAKDASYSATLADVDGDADLDVVVSNDFELGRVYLNDGRGNLTTGSTWGNAGWPTRNATIVDLNGDGRPDVVAANRGVRPGRLCQVCLNDGQGTFKTCTELAVGPATTIAAADFDKDGDTDLAAVYRDGGQSLLLYNDGKAGFGRTQPFGPPTTAARTAAAGDLNGDGWPDLVVGDERVSSFVYLNDGRGGLDAGRRLRFDNLPTPFSMVIGDLNRDGRQDVVIGYSGDRGSVLFNDGTGQSFKHVRFGDTAGAIYGLALGDLDADGYPDIVAARNGAPNVVYFNRSGPGVDTVLAVAPPAGGFDPDSAKLGVWAGRSAYGPDYKWDVRIEINDLRVGKPSGYSSLGSDGVNFCDTRLTLKEHKSDGTYLFTSRGMEGCANLDETVEARWSDDDHVQWSTQPAGAAQAPRAKADLERRSRVPAALFEGVPRDPSNPSLGVWRGRVSSKDDKTNTWDLEISLDRLVVREPAGKVVGFTASPSGRGDFPYCAGQLTLKEQKPGGVYVLSQTYTHAACSDDEVQIRSIGADRLQLEWFWSGSAGPDATAVLERKKVVK